MTMTIDSSKLEPGPGFSHISTNRKATNRVASVIISSSVHST